MSTSVVLPENLAKAMGDKVKEAIFGLLPEEVIQQKIQEEFKAFFESPTSPFHVSLQRNNYGSNYEVVSQLSSPFRVLVWNELKR